MEQTTTTATAYKVSQQTANYINCLQKCSELFTSLLGALDFQYGKSSCSGTELMETDFAPAINQVRTKLYKYIGQSIEEQQAILMNKNQLI